MDLGQKIARLREIRGMKQTDLAQRLGISQQALSKLENNDYIDDRKLRRIAEALGVSTHTILQFQEELVLEEIEGKRNTLSNNLPFDPMEKIMDLYEQLLETERKRIALLEELLREKEHHLLA